MEKKVYMPFQMSQTLQNKVIHSFSWSKIAFRSRTIALYREACILPEVDYIGMLLCKTLTNSNSTTLKCCIVPWLLTWTKDVYVCIYTHRIYVFLWYYVKVYVYMYIYTYHMSFTAQWQRNCLQYRVHERW